MILRLKEARKGKSGGKRVVVTETAEDAMVHGRIHKRSGAFYVESEHLVVEFPADEAVVVWKLLEQVFGAQLRETPKSSPGAAKEHLGQHQHVNRPRLRWPRLVHAR